MIPFIENHGGRAEAGFRIGKTRDCVCRAIAIVSGRPYRDVYDQIIELARAERRYKSHPRTGVWRGTYQKIIVGEMGFLWYAAFRFGDKGPRPRLVPESLPPGRLIAGVRGHIFAVLDGVRHDAWNHDRTPVLLGYYAHPLEMK